jgi:ATP-dependent DNA helicase RecQ
MGVLDSAKQAYPEVLVEPIDQAKFLCGISTTAFRRYRIYKDPGYGICDHVRFVDVLASCCPENS